ncbi:MAG: proline--tRNA ligase, partial [Synergistes sp.]|nr:proline--tRNA ligase [Synergistes sp.]
LIGAIIMTHSDNDGLILPPRIAPTKAVIVPISTNEEKLASELMPKAEELKAALNKALGVRSVTIDTQFHLRPGDRFFSHLQKGVPLRLELGEKEYAAEKLRVVRRDTGEKIDVAWADATEVIPALLDAIQQNLYKRALDFRLANTHHAENIEEFKKQLEEKGGFIEVYFAGTKEDEQAIKEATGATPRCYPLAASEERGRCFFTGKEGARKAIFAKSY